MIYGRYPRVGIIDGRPDDDEIRKGECRNKGDPLLTALLVGNTVVRGSLLRNMRGSRRRRMLHHKIVYNVASQNYFSVDRTRWDTNLPVRIPVVPRAHLFPHEVSRTHTQANNNVSLPSSVNRSARQVRFAARGLRSRH